MSGCGLHMAVILYFVLWLFGARSMGRMELLIILAVSAFTVSADRKGRATHGLRDRAAM